MVIRIDGGKRQTSQLWPSIEGPGVTANVDVADLDGDGWPEIFLNNYGEVGSVTNAGTSTIKTFA